MPDRNLFLCPRVSWLQAERNCTRDGRKQNQLCESDRPVIDLVFAVATRSLSDGLLWRNSRILAMFGSSIGNWNRLPALPETINLHSKKSLSIIRKHRNTHTHFVQWAPLMSSDEIERDRDQLTCSVEPENWLGGCNCGARCGGWRGFARTGSRLAHRRG